MLEWRGSRPYKEDDAPACASPTMSLANEGWMSHA